MKRREFWISANPREDSQIFACDPGGNWAMHFSHPPIHVREVLPGEINITREELKNIMLDDYDRVNAEVLLNKLFETVKP